MKRARTKPMPNNSMAVKVMNDRPGNGLRCQRPIATHRQRRNIAARKKKIAVQCRAERRPNKLRSRNSHSRRPESPEGASAYPSEGRSPGGHVRHHTSRRAIGPTIRHNKKRLARWAETINLRGAVIPGLRPSLDQWPGLWPAKRTGFTSPLARPRPRLRLLPRNLRLAAAEGLRRRRPFSGRSAAADPNA